MHPIKIIIICTLIVSACYPKSQKEQMPRKIKLEFTKSILLPVNEFINSQGYTHLISLEHAEYVVAQVYDGEYNRIFLFDLASQSLEKELRIPAAGPTGVGKISSVITLTHPEGHLLTYEQHTHRFHVVSWEGEYLEKIEVPESTGQVYVAPSLPPYLENDLLLCHLRPEIHPHSRQYLEQARPLSQYSLHTGTQQSLGRFPMYPQALEGSMDVWKVSATKGLGLNSYVYSFPFDDHLYLVKNEQPKQISVPVYRLNLTGIPALDPSSIESHLQGLAHTGYYGYVLTDPHRALYYRLYFPPGEGFSTEGTPIPLQHKPFEIEVFSEDFKWLGSYPFTGGVYNPYSIKVSRKGILLMPLEYPDMEEFIRFDEFVPTAAD
jgi:hypothetical protein